MPLQSSRAAGRSQWLVRRYTLGQEPGADLSGFTTAEQRLEMMWPLALDAWKLTGRPLPDYVRAAMPVKRRRLDDRNRDSG
jgi:hypothetical protein